MTSTEMAQWTKFENSMRNGGWIAESTLQEAGAFAIEHIQANTPIVTGKLQLGWTGGRARPAIDYARSVPINRSGHNLSITFTNKTQYASWVEYGHAQEVGRYVYQIDARLVREWVPGFYYATNGLEDANETMGKWLEITVQRDLNKLV